jgi:hypothetical protein
MTLYTLRNKGPRPNQDCRADDDDDDDDEGNTLCIMFHATFYLPIFSALSVGK